MASSPFVCNQCTRALRCRSIVSFPRLPRHPVSPSCSRPYSSQDNPKQQNKTDNAEQDAHKTPQESSPPERGAMSRRLEEATEEALLSGGRAGLRAVQDAGFDEELRDRLLDKLASAQFRSEHSGAFSAAGLGPGADGSGRIPQAAGSGTRDVATAKPWTGEEATEDAVLRMLDDAHAQLRPGLRGKPRIPTPSSGSTRPGPVDLRFRREPRVSAGRKAASARDKATTYAGMGWKEAEDRGLTPEEREAMRKEFKERFTPGARAMPNTVSGLAALANERIEDAIARGQFKNIPRGKGVERDTRADNPFVDTTEYLMNKMIKRQEIVPPWIEKQQDLVKDARVFRARLRNDWKRHAARMIASTGGSLQEQMGRAEEYARAEEVHNSQSRHVDQKPILTNAAEDTVAVEGQKEYRTPPKADIAASEQSNDEQSLNIISHPFRDPAWEAAERSYMELAITKLNTVTRAYNLMAPELAKKPYFSLERELKNCYAEVAPQLADEIKQRAARPSRSLVGDSGDRPRTVFDRFGNPGATTKIYESKAPKYGFKEMWRDLWNRSP